MQRSRSYTLAAFLMVLYSAYRVVEQLPFLARGEFGNEGVFGVPEPGPPFWLIVATFVIGVLGLVAAYGVWRAQKWGIVLSIILSALGILATLPGVMFAPLLPLRLWGVVLIVWSAAIIVLLLRPSNRRSAPSELLGTPH
jgi:hypothetical protein